MPTQVCTSSTSIVGTPRRSIVGTIGPSKVAADGTAPPIRVGSWIALMVNDYYMIVVIWHNMIFIIECQMEDPMPWSKDHKQATRGRIVEAASSALRARGAGGG